MNDSLEPLLNVYRDRQKSKGVEFELRAETYERLLEELRQAEFFIESIKEVLCTP